MIDKINGFELEAVDLCKSYNRQVVLRNFNMHLHSGETVGLSGINGSGKSTMIRLLTLVDQPDSGEILINGENIIKKKNSVKKYIGYAPQDIALFDELTVMDNFKYFCYLEKNKAKNNIQELISAFDMAGFKNKKITKLSGGMKKRVNLAVALVNNPRILIADEPFVGLDSKQRNKVIRYLHELSNRGLTQIISSHYIENINEFATSVYKFTDDTWVKEEIRNLL